MKHSILSFFVILCAMAVTVFADQRSDIARAMAQRLPQIDAMKERQVVGENNRGYLEVRGQASAADRQVVDAENHDRGVIYRLIAQETGTSPDAVGRLRAQKIAEISKAGVWLQDQSGRWYRK